MSITAKVLKVTTHGDSASDFVVETSVDGQVLGAVELRINRVGNEAEKIALEMASRMAQDVPRPSAPAKKPKPTKGAE